MFWVLIESNCLIKSKGFKGEGGFLAISKYT